MENVYSAPPILFVLNCPPLPLHPPLPYRRAEAVCCASGGGGFCRLPLTRHRDLTLKVRQGLVSPLPTALLAFVEHIRVKQRRGEGGVGGRGWKGCLFYAWWGLKVCAEPRPVKQTNQPPSRSIFINLSTNKHGLRVESERGARERLIESLLKIRARL